MAIKIKPIAFRVTQTDDKEKAEWQSAANYAARKALRYMRGPWLAEDLLRNVLKYVPEPADRRQFGPVIQALARDKVIDFHGYAPAKTSRGSPKCQWRKMP